MARRKASPNIPADTLARARAQASMVPATTEDTEVETSAAVTPPPAPVVPRSTTKRLAQARAERVRQKGELDGETIKERLLNPTRFPTVGELKSDYTYVVNDLRNMFLLSGALIVMLVLIATFAP